MTFESNNCSNGENCKKNVLGVTVEEAEKNQYGARGTATDCGTCFYNLKMEEQFRSVILPMINGVQ